MPLAIPTPVFSTNGAVASEFFAQSSIELTCGPVTFSDGTLISPANATQAGFLLFRQKGAMFEVWNESATLWQSAQPTLQRLVPAGDKWKAWLVPPGQLDQNKAPKLATDFTSLAPQYFARCFFAGKNKGLQEPLTASVPSSSVKIFDGSERRGGLVLLPKSTAPLTEVGMYLGGSPQTAAVAVSVLQTSSGFIVELKGNGASLRLTESGDIELNPASGKKVLVNGALAVSTGITVGGTLLSVP